MGDRNRGRDRSSGRGRKRDRSPDPRDREGSSRMSLEQVGTQQLSYSYIVRYILIKFIYFKSIFTGNSCTYKRYSIFNT